MNMQHLVFIILHNQINFSAHIIDYLRAFLYNLYNNSSSIWQTALISEVRKINFRQLEYFVKVAEYGSFTKASQALYTSQPNLTKSISALEEEYHTILFTRKNKGVSLTQEGRNFLYYANSILASIQTLNDNITDKPSVIPSRLFLATQQFDFLYDLISKCYEKNSDSKIHFVINETNRGDVAQKVIDGSFNLGILVANSWDGHSLPWINEQISEKLSVQLLDTAIPMICVGPTSRYYHRNSVTHEEILNVTNIAIDMEDRTALNLLCDNQQAIFNNDNILFTNSTELAINMLLNTDSVAYVAKWLMNRFKSPAIKVLPILHNSTKDSENQLLLLKKKDVPLSDCEQSFIDMLAEYFHLDSSTFFH